ncbi:MAG: 1-deoxy-D-xylulose-5-phosphate reductoisomerase [Azonexus sp.]|nr:1-deoxy-D-xylulose-5-phosphate reductoisomerase [Betaproteobacteria bacterium]MBK8917957.1 1-deoxy-D-xylulose-5-phosphate reductoisomerase [Betaproteobacteria bacterium]MBP6036413.1 1-deoxy-D-xylulose-5-phosphate reductoisomerase [Azonexus sp.]MBP6907022.1 1-deoxy-D-xylulose-5-phosphate reductoisomerase [Azonexus sp.]
MSRQRLTLLGCTGSIGVSTLDVVRRHRERYEVFALCAHSQVDRLFEQCLEFRPVYAVLRDAALAADLEQRLAGAKVQTEVLHGVDALVAMATHAEVTTVMAAIVGAAGLTPTLAAARAGKRILLANKEALVMAGELFMAEARRGGAVLLPVDSEHNAIFQSLPVDFSRGLAPCGVRRILLTASGGPFRTSPVEALAEVTPEAACAHPNWVMGRKISVDSATMMNKGLEVIEARWLFDCQPQRIEVVVHPQSVIHSLVDYVDGSTLAQLGNPDMRTPIAHALAYPERVDSGVEPLDLFRIARLDFERPDFARFPCLALAYEALRRGGTAPAILNAANEVAVAAFLERRLPFLGIGKLIAATLEGVPAGKEGSLDDVLDADAQARRFAEQAVRGHAAP